jgi:hypothetical protein
MEGLEGQVKDDVWLVRAPSTDAAARRAGDWRGFEFGAVRA